MRILLLWEYYESYLRQFYLRSNGIDVEPYESQNRLLLTDGFNWPAYLVPEFRALGHQAEAIVANADPGQTMWAHEHSCPLNTGPSRRRQIVREQVRQFRPDILWIGGADHYLGDFMRSIRGYCGSVVAWRAASGGERIDWSGIDCVLSSHANFVESFRNMGLRSEQILPCVDPNLSAECSSPGIRDRDVTFVGTLSAISFTKRLDLLSAIPRHISCHVHSERILWRRRPWPIPTFLSQLRYLPFRLRTRLWPATYGREMLRLLGKSKIVLNSHVDSATGLSGNIRMFESTAMGALLLTELSPNLSQLFKPGEEVVSYRSVAEAIDKLRYYLDRPDEREAIANAGRLRSLREHNSKIRAEQVLNVFSGLRLA